MIKTDIGRTVAAIACTLVMSTACVLSAVGPAQANGAKTVAAAIARPVA